MKYFSKMNNQFLVNYKFIFYRIYFLVSNLYKITIIELFLILTLSL